MAKPQIDVATITARANRGQPYGLSTTVAAPELSERVSGLSPRMRELARSYIGARQRVGVAILDAARWMSEANQEAQYGEWQTFLDATETSPDHAEYLMGVHRQAMVSPIFADAIRRNFLSLSAAYELISAPPDVQARFLESEQPITRKQIRDGKRAANSAPARNLDQPEEPTAPSDPTLEAWQRPPPPRTDDHLPMIWVSPTCGKFVAIGELAKWAGEQRERLSDEEREMLTEEATRLIAELEAMIEALS